MIAARRLAACARGGAIHEFAMVLPVLLVLMTGLGDLCYQVYVQSVLTGAVQQAGRDSTVQGNDARTDAIDAVVKKRVSTVAPSATFTSTRTNYDSYAAMAGEPFTDSKYPAGTGTYDGVCNHGETYTDVNGNKRYDLDLGASGQGGANDVTRYKMTVTIARLFPLASMIGWSPRITLTAATLLRNQPYATQTVNGGTSTGTCP